MRAAQEDHTVENHAGAEGESALAREWRVMAVAAVWSLPGALLGALLRLIVPDGGPVLWWMVGATVLAATFGGLLEADHLI